MQLLHLLVVCLTLSTAPSSHACCHHSQASVNLSMKDYHGEMWRGGVIWLEDHQDRFGRGRKEGAAIYKMDASYFSPAQKASRRKASDFFKDCHRHLRPRHHPSHSFTCHIAAAPIAASYTVFSVPYDCATCSDEIILGSLKYEQALCNIGKVGTDAAALSSTVLCKLLESETDPFTIAQKNFLGSSAGAQP